MSYPLLISIVIILAAITVFVYKLINRKKRREEFNDNLLSFFDHCIIALTEYEVLIKPNEYINHFKTFQFKSKYKHLKQSLNPRKIAHHAYDGKVKDTLLKFIFHYNNLDKDIAKHNLDFIKNELITMKGFFDNIEGKSLDENQRKAIVTDEDNNLIIAGAGSGKTLTIAGKVKYLVEKQNIPPSEILLISFTKNSAIEMQERIRERMGINIEAMTFHKLGLNIIAEIENEAPSIADLPRKKQLEIFGSFIENLRTQRRYNNKYLNFLIHWMTPLRQEGDFKSNKEYIEYMQDQKCEGLKLIKKGNYTFREKLKSQEEVLIANFLFKNDIEYRYEEKYKYKTASKKFGQYKPDFYLPKYDIYIEHFGIDKDGNVPHWFKSDGTKSAKEKYNEGIEWKRNEHKLNTTSLVETFSWENTEGVLLDNLKSKLEAHNVSFNPRSNEDIYEYLEKESRADIDALTLLITTFNTLLRSNNKSISELMSQASRNNDKREVKFLELVKPVVEKYNQMLIDEAEIDFSDMINKATSYIEKGQYLCPFRYIIIDEFQDVSLSRYELIKGLLDSRPQAKLFCVGDDWQSIFRFAGSDIGIFTQFNDLFASSQISGFSRKTSTSYIEKTYRFYDKMISLSSRFVLTNPNQINKNLTSQRTCQGLVTSLYSYSDDITANIKLAEILTNIGLRAKGQSCSVLLLGRYNHDIDKFIENVLTRKYSPKAKAYIYSSENHPTINIKFRSVHAAKGLEADYVVLLNGNSGKYGFPSEVADDPILNYLLSDSDNFLNGEERRLFYVAMTRCREFFYVLSNSNFRSKFVEEIFPTVDNTDIPTCPWCDMGNLIERVGPFGSFYACDNHHYCNYTESIYRN